MAEQKTITATGLFAMGDAADGAVASWVIDIASSGGTFSLTPQTRVRPPIGAASTPPYRDAAYETLTTGAAVTAGTAITAAGSIKIPCDACDAGLNVTAISGSTLTITYSPIVG
jgi:hypothetical protein